MSLKTFHIVFIVISTLLTFGFGAWSLKNYFTGEAVLELVFGLLSLAAGAGLVVYGKYVFKKLKQLN